MLGAPVGFVTADAGLTWKPLPDGSTGFATTCNTLSNYCGVFKYVPAAVA